MGYELRHRQIVESFGYAKLADLLCLSKTTVHSWYRAGVIPSRYHPAILNVAKKAGVELNPADFIGLAARSVDVQ